MTSTGRLPHRDQAAAQTRRYGILPGAWGFVVWDCWTGHTIGRYPTREEAKRAIALQADIMTARQSLNQLTDHGSQRCLDCLKYRQNGMDALDRLERGMRWMERRAAVRVEDA